MDPLWRVELLPGIRARCGDRVLTHFPTRKTAALLAYLAYHLHREHPREILIDLLWPECDLDAGRNRLNVAVSTLRHLLESSPSAGGRVLLTDRASVRLNPDAVTTDATEFEASIRAAARSPTPGDEKQRLEDAARLYGGPLLEGYYEDWIGPEQDRLGALFSRALDRLIRLAEEEGDLGGALAYARQAVASDPLSEEACRALMRLCAAAGHRPAALRHYQELEQVLQRELGVSPSVATRALAAQLRMDAGVNGNAARLHISAGPDRPRLRTTPLPAPLTRFFGRAPETARLLDLLAPQTVPGTDAQRSTPNAHRSTRLVTLTGPGGSGKTRLALHVAARLYQGFGGRVWFVSLADLGNAARIPARIAATVLPPGTIAGDPVEQFAAALRDEPALLVLDNFEQHVDAGSGLVAALLQRAPELLCLVTSRRRLNVSGEQELVVPPLPVPPAMSDPEALSGYESVQLFVDRSRAVRAGFSLTAENAAAVAELCTRLEGIPLALELAAARAHVLAPRQMLAHLEDRLGFLVGHRSDTEAHHHTLRAALDWSYRLLAPDLQRFFAALSVFRGGWSLEAADFVWGCMGVWVYGCENPPTPIQPAPPTHSHTHTPTQPSTPTQLAALEQLRSHSLILAEERRGEIRFGMLETLREYAASCVPPEEREALLRCHAEYFLRLAEGAAPHLRAPDAAEWLERLEPEQDNFRAALSWSVERRAWSGRTPKAQGPTPNADLPPSSFCLLPLRLAAALSWFWLLRGYGSEGALWLRRALEAAPASPAAAEVRLRALHAAGELGLRAGEYAWVAEVSEASLALSRENEQESGIAQSLARLGFVALKRCEYDRAAALYTESLGYSERAADRWGIVWANTGLALVAQERGEYERAVRLHEQNLALFEELGSRHGAAWSLHGIQAVRAAEGRIEEADALCRETRARFRELGEQGGVASVICAQGVLALAREDWEQAEALSIESLSLCQNIGDRWGIPRALHVQGCAAWRRGDEARAARLFREALDLWQELGNPQGVAACLAGLGCVAAGGNDLERGVLLLAAAASRRREIGAVEPYPERLMEEAGLQQARAHLGADAFQRLWTKGLALSPDAAIAMARAWW